MGGSVVTKMKDDIADYGIDSIEVTIHGPFNDQNVSHETRLIYKQLGFSGEQADLPDDVYRLYKVKNYMDVFRLEPYKQFTAEKTFRTDYIHKSHKQVKSAIKS